MTAGADGAVSGFVIEGSTAAAGAVLGAAAGAAVSTGAAAGAAVGASTAGSGVTSRRLGGGRFAESGTGTAAEISSSVKGADWTGRLNPAANATSAVVASQSSKRVLRMATPKLRHGYRKTLSRRLRGSLGIIVVISSCRLRNVA
jgi:hypothetical protein